MLREEIKKYIKYSSILREKIKNEKDEKKRQTLIKELCDIYSKLEFLRGYLYARNKKERSDRKI